MKNKIIIICLSLFSLVYGQINVQTGLDNSIGNQNPFLDASAYSKSDNNIGKGLYFPTTDLTKWEFKTDLISPGTFSNYFNGMIVYNSGTGKTITDITKGGKQIDVTPGFYYFKNPNQTFPDGSIENGEWVKLIEANRNEGLRLTNMTTQEINAIQNPTMGEMVFNTDLKCLQVYNGSKWNCTNGEYVGDFTYRGKIYNGAEYARDRNFGDGVHDFIYKVILGPDGKRWLNNNLGADYANVHSNVFNPDQQATSPTDYHAYGSLFQWQRGADGHELINWASATEGTPKYGSTDQFVNSWVNSGTNKFVISNSSIDYSWVNSNLNNKGPYNLWQTGGATNPCPNGFHVPTHDELVTLHNAIEGRNVGDSWISSSSIWKDNILRLTALGNRDAGDGEFNHLGFYGNYWSSSKYYNNIYSFSLSFRNNYKGSNNSTAGNHNYRGNGFGIRCIQD